MPKKYRIELLTEEREELTALSCQKRGAAYKVSKARALLLTDEGPDGPAFTDEQIVSKTGMILRTIERLRKRCHEVGPLEALEPIARTHVSCKPALDDDQEARLVQIACSEAPPGCARWTMKLLAGKLVELEIVEGILPETVRQALKKRPQTLVGKKVGVFRQKKMPYL
jgi:hypothetical protein